MTTWSPGRYRGGRLGTRPGTCAILRLLMTPPVPPESLVLLQCASQGWRSSCPPAAVRPGVDGSECSAAPALAGARATPPAATDHQPPPPLESCSSGDAPARRSGSTCDSTRALRLSSPEAFRPRQGRGGSRAPAGATVPLTGSQ